MSPENGGGPRDWDAGASKPNDHEDAGRRHKSTPPLRPRGRTPGCTCGGVPLLECRGNVVQLEVAHEFDCDLGTFGRGA